MIKRSIYQKDMTTIHIYDLQQSSKVLQSKLTEFKGDVDNSTIIVGNLIFSNGQNSYAEHSKRSRNLTPRYKPGTPDNHRMLHLTTANTHSSQVYTEHSPGYTLNLTSEVIQSAFTNHNEMILEIK